MSRFIDFFTCLKETWRCRTLLKIECDAKIKMTSWIVALSHCLGLVIYKYKFNSPNESTAHAAHLAHLSLTKNQNEKCIYVL